MPALLPRPDRSLLLQRAFGCDEDFLEFVSGDLFFDTSGDSGAAVASTDAVGGVVTLTTGGTDNNECYLHTTKELFKFAAGKPLFFEARIQYAEANTDDANVIVGFLDAAGANAIVDDGAGPKGSYSGALFFKVDGGTRWNVETSVGGTQNTLELTAANSLDRNAHAAGGSSFQVLRIEVNPLGSAQAEASFFIDGVHVAKLLFSLTGATEMHAIVGVKAGGANSEVVSVDYLSAWQLR